MFMGLSSKHLTQLLTWTQQVSGPLAVSQELLVRQLTCGSSSSSSAGALDAEQVTLLRRLLGLV